MGNIVVRLGQAVSVAHGRALLAADWGSDLVNLGPVGHINIAAGFGRWSEGYALFARLKARPKSRQSDRGSADCLFCKVRIFMATPALYRSFVANTGFERTLYRRYRDDPILDGSKRNFSCCRNLSPALPASDQL